MQSSYWGYWLVVMGVAIVGLMISVQGITTTTTQDYLSLKEITEASMLEAVDYGYYRDYNEVKMNKEKFMEVFIRMMAETVGNETYEINFYEMYEAPPKVSVEIKTNSGTDFVSSGYDVTSRISAVIQIHAEQVGSNGSNPSGGSGGSLPDKDDKPSGGGSTVPDDTQGVSADSLKEYIIDNAEENEYYACNSRYCEKKSETHIKSFACFDYNNDYHTNLSLEEIEDCIDLVSEIYDELPERINK